MSDKSPTTDTVQPTRRKRKVQTPFSKEAMEFHMSPQGHMTKAMLEKFGDEMLQFVFEHEEVVNIRHFYIMKGVNHQTFSKWCDKNPYLRHCYEQCRNILSIRREQMMIDRTNNPHPLLHSQHLYSKEWDGCNKYHADLKNKNENKSDAPQVIYLKEFPKTNEVPEKNDKNSDTTTDNKK